MDLSQLRELERALSFIDDLPRMPLRQALDAFLLNGEAKNLSPRTVQYYREQVGPFCEALEAQGVQNLLSLKAQQVRAYLLELRSHRSPGGQAAAYRAIRAFVNWGWDEYDLPDTLNPLRKVPAPKVSRDPKPAVELEDVEAMLATCQRGTFTGDRDRAALYCLLDTGCRASEFVALNVEDVILETGAVHVRHGKGNKARTTFLGERSRASLHHYLSYRDTKAGDPLWTTVSGGRLAYSGLRQIIRRRAGRAGVPVPTLHSFRRGFAVGCLRNGVDLVSLQRLLGHADLSVVKSYLPLVNEDLRRAHAQGSPVDRRWGH